MTAARFTVVLLSVMIAYGSLLTGYPNITFPWYLNTEEFPYIQEILRFSELDFRQQFFDIPGTPLMTLGTAIWSAWYWICVAAGVADASHGIRYFSFEHMQWLYGLMRVISHLCYGATVVLTYAIGRRLTNAVGGYVAALLLVLSPMYGQTMLYLRIESTSLALVLCSVWSVLRALDTRQYRWYVVSGVAAGLAMAARFPSMLAGFPVVLLYAIVFPVVFSAERHQRLNDRLFAAIPPLLIAGGVVAQLARLSLIRPNRLTNALLVTTHGSALSATHVIAVLWLALLLAGIGLIGLHASPRTRPLVQRVVHSSAATVTAGFLIGVVLGVPTLLWSGQYFLDSMEMFHARNQLGQPFIHGLSDVIRFFLFGLVDWSVSSHAPPSTEVGVCFAYWHIVLLAIGALMVLIGRRRLLYPILGGAVVGILCQYGKLQTTRHLVAWLPYFLILMALPIAAVWDRLRGVFAGRLWLERTATIVVLAVMFASTYPVQVGSLSVIRRHFQEKVSLLPALDRWLDANTDHQAPVFHVCCEPITRETILDWMQRNGVRIPVGIRKSERSVIWFGDREPLVKAGKGYIVISTDTFPGQYIDYYRKMRPESLVDPFTDRHFSLQAVIDAGLGNSYRIYSFQFRG